ncbi:DUF2155 domain-containing protein [Rubellimicrobium sp. CFH 75288]|uniref:DUF2155 domain-containing protein n=1 Tax=Rubellimicrobium sp. CFH 75288 TaxID=2697034 RepID=UPI0014127637|nr:DUF2155 domain-containing protein [Rubellimicrobium sp. CFH 75288]NAZ37883.1 DUF2155 domain-containing protein [Rubellimicrobium sp. CFH 75288]
MPGPLALLLSGLLAATAAPAQERLTLVPPTRTAPVQGPDEATAERVAAAPGAATGAAGGVLRVLDKIDGSYADLELRQGEEARLGSLVIAMAECRHPADNPAGDAFALVSIHDARDGETLFQGWLIASAPALHAMDHPRYDVWALRCLRS